MEKKAILEKFPRSPDVLLALLHALQRANPQNYLTHEDLELAAQYLGLPLSRVRDAVTFYTMFSLKPRGKHIIRVCASPNCHLAGAWSVLEELKGELGIDVGETTPDGLFTLECTSCLGVCGVAPVMMVDEEVVGNLTPLRAREVIRRIREGG
ncbi:MAG: NAD(P)H-dependent oxidoreductase subunit E [Candidatus Bipolaricaulota bacterium]|nr:NAD(P)H-dependent oxidoreductase subunit E [Candidatus Bipolaricaulota bacterium]MDW8126452.1 NAD(P)H-dependent oxidoreductase subunit E [Candidatus Bipolaricaulota bacterium]